MKKKMKRMWRQLTADKKKFGFMVTALMVGLLLWGRLILLERVPRHATADPGAEQNPRQQAATPPSPTPESAPILPPLPEVRADLSDELALDLFAFRYDRYSLIPREDSPHDVVQQDPLAVDEQVRRRELQERLRVLRLQSVIQGSTPLIVINGRVLRVGDSIDGFVVASFDESSVLLTRDGLTFPINMLPE